MNPLFNALTAYFSTNTPEARASALTALVEAYNQAKDAPEPETLALPPDNLARLRALAGRVNLDSAQELLSAIVDNETLLDRIAVYLSRPAGSDGLPPVVVRPAGEVETEAIAWIAVDGDRVQVRFPEKRDNFRELVKGLDYTWDWPYWYRLIDFKAGQPAHRAAELGHRLLAAGFCVVLPTAGIRDMAITGGYEPEQRRWVLALAGGDHQGWFALWWAYSEDCYAAAKKISGSHYAKPYVIVPPEHYDEVLDFARMYDFRVSSSARRIADQARQLREGALVVTVAPVEANNGPVPAAGFPDLDIPDVVEIDENLVDDD